MKWLDESDAAPKLILALFFLGVGLLIFVMARSWATTQATPKPAPQAVPGTFIGPCPMFVELPVWEWEDVDRIGRRLPAFTDSLCVRLHWEELD